MFESRTGISANLSDTEASSVEEATRATTQGKFLFVGEDKLYIKGVSYGTFAESEPGVAFPTPTVVERDFALMRDADINTVRVYTVPPEWLLDLAQAHALCLVVGIPWPQHLCIRTQQERAAIRGQIRDAIKQTSAHPAVLAYFIGSEIPASIVRWYGKTKTEGLLHELYDAAKQVDAAALVSYANFPSTEYLELPFLDFLAFNVYLHERRDFRAYLAKLQSLAGPKPIVLSEFGLDSLHYGREVQATFLDWSTLR